MTLQGHPVYMMFVSSERNVIPARAVHTVS